MTLVAIFYWRYEFSDNWINKMRQKTAVWPNGRFTRKIASAWICDEKNVCFQSKYKYECFEQILFEFCKNLLFCLSSLEIHSIETEFIQCKESCLAEYLRKCRFGYLRFVNNNTGNFVEYWSTCKWANETYGRNLCASVEMS